MNGSGDPLESMRLESEGRLQALSRLFAGADSSRVFGQPVSAGEYTVIPAAEIAGGGGFGSGMGFGGPRFKGKGADQLGAVPAEGAGMSMEGVGGGGGGGGGSMGRPVAVIAVGPDGVTVKPVFDMTKLALTALGAWGAAAALAIRMWSKK